jgi:hypothetical protein
MNKEELIMKLKKIGIDENYYSLDSGLEDSKVILKHNHGIWEFFVCDERCNQYDNKKFFSEEEAYEHVYQYFKESPASITGKKKMQERKEKYKPKKPINTSDVIILDK